MGHEGRAIDKTRILAEHTWRSRRRRTLLGTLTLPAGHAAVVVFAHGSGSGRFSPRNQYVAHVLQEAGLGTLLLDLLEESEADDRARSSTSRSWPAGCEPRPMAGGQPRRRSLGMVRTGLGCFGSAPGEPLWQRPSADPSARSSRAEAGPTWPAMSCRRVTAPTLLIVGGNDEIVLELNREAYELLKCPRQLDVVPGASHLFPEPGALEEVARLAQEWFLQYLIAVSRVGSSRPWTAAEIRLSSIRR